MHFATFILKPDFFETMLYFDVLLQMLKKYNIEIDKCYLLNNYTTVNDQYRKLDLRRRFNNNEDFEKNYSRTKIARDAYSLLNINNIGVLSTLKPTVKKSKTEFYNDLNNIKVELRKIIEKSRGYVFLYVKNQNILIKAKKEEFERLKIQYGNDIKLAFINGIHLEDYELFNKKYCYKTFKKLKHINKTTQIDLNTINSLITPKGE